MTYEELMESETEYGYPVRDIETIGGIHLIYKVPLEDRERFLLPEITKLKSIRNIVTIRGLVLVASQPFRRKHKTKKIVWDNSIMDWKMKWNVWDAHTAYPSSLKSGDGIIYTSYKLGALKVEGLSEPLQFIREMDIDLTIPREAMPRVGLSEKAMECSRPYV